MSQTGAATVDFPEDKRCRYLLRNRLGNLWSADMYSEPEEGIAVSTARKVEIDPVTFYANTGRIIPAFSAWEMGSGSTVTKSIEAVVMSSDAHATGFIFTVSSSYAKEISSAVTRLLAIARDENFQDGMESNLSAGITTLMRRFPIEVFEIVADAAKSLSLSIYIRCEILYTLGRIDSPATKGQRFSLLVDLLQDKSPIIRDAAGTALAYMDDPRAIRYLEKAIDTEVLPSLKTNLKSVVDQLVA